MINWENTGNLFMTKTHADVGHVLPTLEQSRMWIKRFNKAKRKAQTKERKRHINNIIEELEILMEQL